MNYDHGHSTIIIKKSLSPLKLIYFINKTFKLFVICSSMACLDSENDIHITENDVEGILFDQYINSNIIIFTWSVWNKGVGWRVYTSAGKHG